MIICENEEWSPEFFNHFISIKLRGFIGCELFMSWIWSSLCIGSSIVIVNRWLVLLNLLQSCVNKKCAIHWSVVLYGYNCMMWILSSVHKLLVTNSECSLCFQLLLLKPHCSVWLISRKLPTESFCLLLKYLFVFKLP